MKKLGTITRKASMWALLCMAVVLCFSLVMLSFGTIAKADDEVSGDPSVEEDVTDGNESGDDETGDSGQEGDTPAAIELTESNVRFDVAGINFTGNNSYKPTVKVYYTADSETAEILLTERTVDEGDYIITYGDTRNVDVSEPRFQITGVNEYSGVVNGTFTISPATVALGDLTVNKSALTYNGEVQMPAVTFFYNNYQLIEGTDYTVTSSGAVSGQGISYTFTGSANINNYTFSDTYDISPATDNSWTMLGIVSWMQGKFSPNVNVVNSSVKYGQAQAKYSIYRTESNGTIVGSALVNFVLKDNGVMDISNDTVETINALEAGNYKLRASVSAANGLYNAAERDYDFVITAPSYKKPVLTLITEGAGKNDTYTGNALAMNVSNYDVNGMTVSYSEGITLEGSTLYARNAGTYEITFALTDAEAYWGTDAEDKSPVTLTWTIAKKKVAVPGYGSDTFTYNGKLQTYLPEGFNSELMTISGNTATDKGEYNAVISLKDPANYQWESNAYGDSAVIVHRYEIENSTKAFTILISILIVVLVLGAVGVVLQYYMHKQRLKIFAMASKSVKENNEGGNK